MVVIVMLLLTGWTGLGLIATVASVNASGIIYSTPLEMMNNNCSKQKNNVRTEQIMGGKDTSITNHPWQVSLQYIIDGGKRTKFCGGSIIHEKWVVTAAHCHFGRRPTLNYKFHVVAGASKPFSNQNAQFFTEPQIEWIVHEKYVSKDKKKIGAYDIALIHIIDGCFHFNERVQKIHLPEGNELLSDWTECKTTGYGMHSNKHLAELPVSLVDHKECGEITAKERNRFDNGLQTKYTPQNVISAMAMLICVWNKHGSACPGDSGGPLACKKGGTFYVVGATSFMILDRQKRKDCTLSTCEMRLHTPFFYSSILTYRKWICRTAPPACAPGRWGDYAGENDDSNSVPGNGVMTSLVVGMCILAALFV